MYLNDMLRGKTAYVPNSWHDITTAIAVIHQAGGVVWRIQVAINYLQNG